MNQTSPNSLRGAAGFTLIELMITVAIIAILTMIAYPSYQQYILKSHRTDAKTALLDLATRQERLFTLQNVYSSAPAALGYGAASFPIAIQSGNQSYYVLSVQQVNNAASSPTYTAIATPTGPQQRDSCGTYSINQLGVQTNTGNTTPTAQCC